MKIAVAGIGYVGLANAILLAQHNNVVLLDINQQKVDMINGHKSPLDDPEIIDYLETRPLNISATTELSEAYSNAEYIIVATPTDFDETSNKFDTSVVETVIGQATDINPSATIVVKSTVPVGFTDSIQQRFPNTEIVFSPEFLREGRALYDSLNPSRIVIGSRSEKARTLAQLLEQGAEKSGISVTFTGAKEAESIKLFSNTFLAMRVAFFNEVDTFAELYKLNPAELIEGICSDDRIGNHYNNPSFGYGGYCLPKDTKQLRANFCHIPNRLVAAVVEANSVRKEHIAHSIIKRSPRLVGVYRLIMKANSDNFRSSSILDIIEQLTQNNIPVVIYEPELKQTSFHGHPVIPHLDEFKLITDLVLTNRMSSELSDIKDKVYTRDIFGCD